MISKRFKLFQLVTYTFRIYLEFCHPPDTRLFFPLGKAKANPFKGGTGDEK